MRIKFNDFVAVMILSAPVISAPGQQTPDESPGARVAPLFVFDSLRGRLVLYGGTFSLKPGGVAHKDPDPRTYAWSGNSWRILDRRGPRTRDEMAYGYDPRDGSVIFFGGRGDSGVRIAGQPPIRIPFRETWKLTDATWTLVDTVGPSGRASPQGAFDVARGRFVVFGGRIEQGEARSFPNETWEWDGRSWQRFDTPGPKGRDGHAMAYDPKAKRVIMHGGSTGAETLLDTWSWDGSRWTQLGTDGPRSVYGGATSALDSGIVLFGGNTRDTTNAVWHWNGVSWRRITAPGPVGRIFNAMATDTRQRRIYMLGGHYTGVDRRAPNPEMWFLDESYQWTKVTPP